MRKHKILAFLSVLLVVTIALSFSSFYVPSVKASPDTVTLRPDEDVSTQWLVQPSGNHYEAVDEETPNDDIDYIYTDGYGLIDRFGLSAHGLTSETINSVTFYYRARKTTEDLTKIRLRVYVDASNFVTTLETLTTDYQTFSQEYTENPITEEAWTIDDLDGLNVCPFSVTDQKMKRCTCVWVVVDYTPSGEEENFFGVINQELSVESTEIWSLTKGYTINQQFALASHRTGQFSKLGIINLITSMDSKTQIAVMKYVFGQINQLFSLASYRTWSFRAEGTINPTFSIESIIQIVPNILNFYGDITQSFQIVQWNDLKPEINLALIVAAFAFIMAITGITLALIRRNK